MTEYEREMLAALQAIRETLGDIHRDLADLRVAQAQSGAHVREQITGGSATFSDLTQNKHLPKRLG